MILAKLKQLFLSNVGFVLLLGSDEDERVLPIFIGAAEAQSIAIWMNKIAVPRPMTHDLLKNTLDLLECRLVRIEVWNLENGTFFARLALRRNGNEMVIDSRPSDAIALALRCDAPIYIAKHVMNEAGRTFEDDEEPGREIDNLGVSPPHSDAAGKDKLPPLKALQKRLEEAIIEERYEDAAKLRDEINRLNKMNTDN